MLVAQAVEAYRDGEAVPLEEVGVVVGQERAVRRDREAEASAAVGGERRGVLGGGPEGRAVGEGFAAEESEVKAGARLGVPDQEFHGLAGGLPAHALGGTAEIALAGVAVGAPEVALLGDGQRERVRRRGGQRCVVDERGGEQAEAVEQPLDGGVAELRRGLQLLDDVRVHVEQPAAVHHEELAVARERLPVRVAHARARRLEPRSRPDAPGFTRGD